MSIDALEWAASLDGLTRLEKTVLKEIANRYNDHRRRAWPSQARMARDTGYSRRSIIRGINSLEEKGLVFRVHAFDSETSGTTSNRYFLPVYDPAAVPTTDHPFEVEQVFNVEGEADYEELQVLRRPRRSILRDS